MQKIIALWGMARPFIMLSVLLVFALGTLIAWAQDYPVDANQTVLGFIALLLVSLSIHYVNEYADFETDALTTPTPFSGGSGVLQRGDIPRALALQAGWVTLLIGLMMGVIGWLMGWIPTIALFILLLGTWGGWMYSMPPLKLAWNGWGEVDNAVLGGMLLPLYGYTLQTGQVDMDIMLGFVPFTLLVFLNLLATTWPDRTADAQVGKRTLATRLQTKALRMVYALVALCAIVCMTKCVHILPIEIILGSLLVIPFVGWGWLRYTHIESPQPSVTSMVVLMLSQMGAWFLIGI